MTAVAMIPVRMAMFQSIALLTGNALERSVHRMDLACLD
jgi:hypothetical protein